MIGAVLRTVVRFRVVVLVSLAGLSALSVWALRVTPLDAIPDISDPQIVVYVKWPRSPQLLEAEVTAPLAKALSGSPGVQGVRGTSHMGYSFIYVLLENGADRTVVRQRVLDKIEAIRSQLPPDANVALGPNASGMGWILQYALRDRDAVRDLRDLRLLNEARIKPALQTVAGVAEVASVGGLEKQYQVKLVPPLLATYGVSLRQIVSALQGVFQEVGGRTIEVTNREYQLRATVGGAGTIDHLDDLVVGRGSDGAAVRLKDVGYLQVGYDLRRSTADLDGAGEVAGGIVIMEQGQNVLAVTRALHARLDALRHELPEGVDIVSTYDRSAWIWATLEQFASTLASEIVVLIAVTLLFLGNLRASVGPIAILLFSTLFAVLPLYAFNQTINLFSLAGLCIAIGAIEDATIVIVENCAAELALTPGSSRQDRLRVVLHAIERVARPLLYSLLIIVASFLPVFFLEAREARLFDPLAFSKTFAMVFSTLLTLLLLPIVAVWAFGRPPAATPSQQMPPRESPLVRAYRSALVRVIRHRYAFSAAGVLVVASAVLLLGRLERDFLPDVDEGAVLYMPTTLPGLPTREAGWVVQQMDKKLKAIPEVDRVFAKLGRADSATDPAPVSMIETTILLKPHDQWRRGLTKNDLVNEMDRAMQIVGYVNSWVQPIRARVMMQTSGIQTPVGLKVKGPELATIQQISEQVEEALKGVPGTNYVLAERIADGYYTDVRLDLSRLADHGIAADDAMLAVRYGIGGDNLVGVKQDDGAVVPLAIQYAPEYLDTLEKVRTTPLAGPDGGLVPLSDVAEVSTRRLPEMIRNDNGSPAGYVYVDIRDTTPVDYVEQARRHLDAAITLPSGYSIEWTGLYQYSEAARTRLRVIVPLTLAIIFALLVLTFRSVSESVLIALSVPFALAGGVFLQWALGYAMTTAVIIGYIAIFAVAVQTGIIMVIFIRQALDHKPESQAFVDAVIDGSTLRLRPKLMTVATIVLSLSLIPISSGPGMEIMKPIAAPSIGGMISSTLHVLFMTPCLFVIADDVRGWWRRRGAHRVRQADTMQEERA